METYNQALNIVQMVVRIIGIYLIIEGMIKFGTGLKDHTGPQMQNGALGFIGGVLVVLAAQLVEQMRVTGFVLPFEHVVNCVKMLTFLG